MPLMTDLERNNVADIVNVEDYSMQITTTTLINKLTATDEEGNAVPCNINQPVAFTLMPWNTINLPTPRRQSRRIKLKNNVEFELEPGSIFSARFEGWTRGLVRSQSRKYLKNSVSIDIIVTKDKYINVKLSSCKLHMCGPRSIRHGEICADFIMKYLYEINDTIEYVRNNPELAHAAFTWVCEHLLGDEVMRPVYREQQYRYEKQRRQPSSVRFRDVSFHDGDLPVVSVRMKTCDIRELERSNMVHTQLVDGQKVVEIVVKVVDHTVTSNHLNPIKDSDIPAHIDRRCVEYFAFNAPRESIGNRISDYTYYEDWLKEAEWLRQCNNVYEYKPHVGSFPTAMTNFNFGLGFSIKRTEMAQLFDKHTDFTGDFDNMRNQNVKIELPYYSNDDSICRKNKSSSVIFIVYKTGKVTLTGPNEKVNMLAFYEFVRYIKEIRPLIENTDIP